jgi:hypothetical protein
MSTSLFFEGLGITVDISSTSATPSTPAAANYTNGTLTDPYTDVDCSRTVTIPCLRTMYNVTGYVPQATSKNKIGITGYLGQFANNADLQSFYKAELPAAVNSSFQTVLVNGACTQRWASCLYMFGSRPDACCAVVHVRWAERPDARECWTGGQLGHPIWPWDVVPDSWNVLLDWGCSTLYTRCAHDRELERAL